MVFKTFCKGGIYSQKTAMQSANKIAGKRSRFCVRLLKAGGWSNIDRRRVRTAIRLNHCLGNVNIEQLMQGAETYITTRLMKYTELASFRRAVYHSGSISAGTSPNLNHRAENGMPLR